MRSADDRAQAGTSRLSEVSQHRTGEWEELLQILKLADSPVGEAIHWLESRGYGVRFGAHEKIDMEGKRRKVSELWRFVPDLLASEVVYVEEEEETKRTGSMGSCIWMQTLPNVVQTNVLTFLNVEHSHFRSKDLEALARRILQCPMEVDFWVFQAAKALLQTSSQNHEPVLPASSGGIGQRPRLADEFSKDCYFRVQRKVSSTVLMARITECAEEQLFGFQDIELADYSKLPEWLDSCSKDSSPMFSWLPLEQSGLSGDEPQDRHDSKDHLSGTCKPSQPDLEVVSTEGQDVKQPMGDPPECERGAARLPGRHIEELAVDEKYTVETKVINTDTKVADHSEEGDELKQCEEVVDEEDDKTRKAILGEDLYLQALSLGRALRSSSEPGVAEGIKLVRSTPKFASFLSVARAWEVDDEVTLLLVGSLLVEQDGYAWSTQVLQSIILPKLLTLEKPASRILSTAVTQAGKIHPRAIMDSVMFPLICSKDGASSVQCELLNRLVKDCLPEDSILSLLQKLFMTCTERNHFSSNLSWKWTEGMVGVVQNLLNYKLNLDEQSTAGLVEALDVAVTEFSKSLKFGNLLLNLVTKHGSRLKAHKALMCQIVDKSQTFLTKSVQSKLAAL